MKNISSISKFIQYVLGYHPDEFGLITDSRGFVKIKTLLQALQDDPEWRFIRQAHLNELLLTCRPALIEIQDQLIRAVDRTKIPQPCAVSEPLPKLLYVSIRRRSQAAIATNGIFPNGGIPYVVLTPVTETAHRLGRRIDPHPVLITVPTAAAMTAGVVFEQYGELYLAAHLPVEGIICPPVAKPVATAAKAEPAQPPAAIKTPGSFFPNPSRFDPGPEGDRSKRRNSAEWKKERRQARKYKKRMQAPETF